MSLPERTPDGHPRVWLLYRQEPPVSDDVWIRRCDVFPTQAAAMHHLASLLGTDRAQSVRWQQHELFPELHIGTDGRGHAWYLEPAPLLEAKPP